ncbi:uncharacterized protein LOC110712037 [Chenopodium quinoa]|uniref:uncharacterized protein LOC110712037 n=1 Tax=Chenopodium quinoa TaxID=63459 RepID=UPI000B778672|nr:uncharacterized protein LOC110712037 [Chenopodium quinoa]
MVGGSGNNNEGGDLSEVVKQGKADLWWQQNETTIKALPGFNWTMFQEKVRDKFYPSFLQKQKVGKFSNLALRDMSVTEYYTKFIELSRFTKESVATEKAKARKFESGLTTDLQLKLCGQVFKTLDKVYGRSAHLYALELKKKKELAEVEGKEKRKEMGQNSGNPQGNKGAQQSGVKSNNNGNDQVKSGAPGKLNVISRHEADTTKDVITGTFSINSIPVKVLFDSGATFSFISKAIVSKQSHCLKTIDVIYVPIVIPTGGVIKCTKTCKDVPLEIKGKVFLFDLIEFGLSNFDIILGMDWLSKYSAKIRCRSQKVQLSTAEGELVTHWKHGEAKCLRIIFMIKLAKYIKKGHPVYFCTVKNLEHEETIKLENIEVVNEFLDVFPEEIPRIPPKRAIDFTIELVPGTTLISKAPYRMAPVEMTELKE